MLLFILSSVIAFDFNFFDDNIESAPQTQIQVKVLEYSEEFLTKLAECPECQEDLSTSEAFTDEEISALVEKGKAIIKVKSRGKTVSQQSSIPIMEPDGGYIIESRTIPSRPMISRPTRVYRSCPTCP